MKAFKKGVIPIDTDELNDLIRRTGQGDMNALEILYREMKDSVYGLALMYTKSYSDADDIVHDTFLAVWKNAAGYRAGGPKSWIMKIARNISLTQIKKQNRSMELDENISEDDFREKVNNSVLLETMLNHLKEREREIVLLHAHGFSHEEIGRITGTPAATIRWKYSRAIRKLSELSGGEI